ncbi:MAG: polyphosphate kinase 1 [Chloroflexota bacterium]
MKTRSASSDASLAVVSSPRLPVSSSPRRRPAISTLIRPDASPESRYFNPELAWLEFDHRVLEEAADVAAHPLLERVKFLAIFHSNLDEFFMIRVAGLLEQVRAGLSGVTAEHLSNSEQLAALRLNVDALLEVQSTLWRKVLKPELAAQGIHLCAYDQLDETQRAAAKGFFEREVFPVLTPLAFDPGHPFPHISNLSLNLAVIVQDPLRGELFARLKVPAILPRLVPVPTPAGARAGSMYFVWLEQIIAAHLDSLFNGLTVQSCHVFRVTRDADMEILEDEAQDLLATVEESLRQRHFGSAVRLELEPGIPETLSTLLVSHLNLGPEDVYRCDGPLARSDLLSLVGLERPDLKDAPLQPAVPPELRAGSDLFATIRRGDVLLHHPYDSFSPVVQLIEQAANDPGVLAIKQTLYRIGHNSPLVDALIRARENGKQVAVLVELKARFDEENNIEWARALEQAGVHVVYGLLGLKTHCKVALIVRREPDGIRRYVHVSTGNYNPGTARVYTDLGMLTCRPEFGSDASELFNYLTGYSRQTTYRTLLVAPVSLRQELHRRVEREIAHAQAGRPARLIFKANTLQDYPVADLLYRAAAAGVQVDLAVRGICIVRPNLPELAGRLRVVSIVGRFLEHSRAFYFYNNGDEELYLGSADLMPRNLDRRVEIVFPIEEAAMRTCLKDEVLEKYFLDTSKARCLQGDGTYTRVRPADGEAALDVQQWLLEEAHRRADEKVPLHIVPRNVVPPPSPVPD